MSFLEALSIVLAFCALGQARAQDAAEFDPRTLAPLLDQAVLVVRAHRVSSQSDPARSTDEPGRYLQFEIVETIKGSTTGRDIRVRHPAVAEGSESATSSADGAPDRDVILLLGPQDPADGSYGAVAGVPNGGYAVESNQDGDWALLKGAGTNVGPVSPKDVHRYDVEQPIPLDVLRRMADAGGRPPQPGASAPATSSPPSALTPPPPQPRGAAVPPPPAVAPAGDEPVRRWMAIAAGLAAIAIVGWLLRRASTSGNR